MAKHGFDGAPPNSPSHFFVLLGRVFLCFTASSLIIHYMAEWYQPNQSGSTLNEIRHQLCRYVYTLQGARLRWARTLPGGLAPLHIAIINSLKTDYIASLGVKLRDAKFETKKKQLSQSKLNFCHLMKPQYCSHDCNLQENIHGHHPTRIKEQRLRKNDGSAKLLISHLCESYTGSDTPTHMWWVPATTVTPCCARR